MRRSAVFVLLLLLCSSPALAQGSGLTGLKFCIDPGHGGYEDANDRHVVPDPGIDFWESESNFQKALLLKALLEDQGATVILTRYNNLDPEPDLATRVAIANSNNVNWFHSIHSNAFNGQVNYTLLLVREKRSLTDPAASTGNGLGIPEQQASWDASAGYISPGIRAKLRTSANYTYLDWTFYGGTNGGFSLGVLRGLLMPGELSEGSFHDYYPETRRLMNNDYRKMEAYAIRNAFMQYFVAPPDTTAIIAGIQKNVASQLPVNFTTVKILPEGRIYTGDQYNNGFYMFDGVEPGPHTIRFETPGYAADSVTVNPGNGATVFVDRTLIALGYPTVVQSTPLDNDTAFAPSVPIRLAFSTIMDTASVRRSFSISPAASGTLAWSNGNTSCTFTPDAMLPFYVNFTVQLDTSAHSSTGAMLDGNGDGTPGDPFILHFRTTFVDVTPPAVVDVGPDSVLGLASPGSAVSITFDELVDPLTITTTNFALQRIGGTVLARTVQGYQANGRSGVTMYPTGGLIPGSSYRVRISGVKDMSGNAIPAPTPFLWTFAVAPGTYTGTVIDSLDGPPSGWISPTSDPATHGLASASFTFTALKAVQSVIGDKGSDVLGFVWDTTAGSWLLFESLDSTHALVQPHWPSHGNILRAFVLGDGSRTQFRFVVDDSVEAFPAGGPPHTEVSPWFSVRWIGWKMVEWDTDRDSTGSWTGNGILEGEIRFRGIQLRYAPGVSAASGSIALDQIEVLERHPVSVDASDRVLPHAFALYPAYPNPFNPSTVIGYQLPGASRVRLVVYDVLGREVSVLVDEVQVPGRHEVRFEAGPAGTRGSGLASGVYFARLRATPVGGGSAYDQTVRLLLTR